MGDPGSHLEKMGRELKCPICWSLLSSAVSLTCNHVFCNECIMKSMKSGSNCPVCKVPYRRREVRTAPHMDNLVSIYKSMEVASGINIFVTQMEPPNMPSDKELQVEGDPLCGEQVIGGICQEKVENQGTSTNKRLRRTTKSNLELSAPVVMKPSFPTKKRVQVAKYPLPETPTQPAKMEGGFLRKTCDELKENSVVSKGNSVVNKEKPVLSPFFWLREEEEVEKSSQHTDEGDTYITPPDVPSFSDLKDSYEKDSSELSPIAEMHGKSDDLDSEIFEWTQRACSPELLPSPIKTQVADTYENDEIKEKNLEATLQVANIDVELCNEDAISLNSEQGNSKVDVGHNEVSSLGNMNSNNQTGGCKVSKRGRKGKDIAIKKCAKREKTQGSETHAALKKDSKITLSDSYGSSLSLEKSKGENVDLCTHATEPRLEIVLDFSVGKELLDQRGKDMVSDLPVTSDKKQGSKEGLHLKNTRKHCRKVKSICEDDCRIRSKRHKANATEMNILEKSSVVQNQQEEVTIPQSSLLPLPVSAKKKTSDLKEKSKISAGKIMSTLNSKCHVESRFKKRKKFFCNVIPKDGFAQDNGEGCSNAAKEIQSPEQDCRSADVRVDNSSREKKLLGAHSIPLLKCDTLVNKIHCSFCLSSECSEASGEMVHYDNGRSVVADYNCGSKLIHSHRNCTEWAPNVYFQDDTAINLEAEIARSRRIKCCCCGLKGAALGCYEKSCRKSYHVPCAKLISQCRWDNDNFVMLCPLHASSKLPNENPGSQEIKRKCISKRMLQTQCNQVAVKNEVSTSYGWNSSQNKLVICWSALTDGEREVVSEFERLSKVRVLKKWDSSVTHVIASTDENGACKRTLKVMLGILEGKWILNIEWVKDCMKAKKPVDEEQYEVAVDVYGIRDGPRLGRLRVLDKRPKLFDGLKFYLMGGFVSSYKTYLQDLVVAGGGTLLHRKPISRDRGALLSASSSSTFIIYSLELPDKCDVSKKDVILNCRRSEAETLASLTGAKAVSNSWVLNSIAACKLQSYAE